MFKFARATLFVAAFTAVCASLPAQDAFPLRKKYPQLKPISTAELAKLDKAIIVDARNNVEYDVLHMEGATNILVGKMKKRHLSKLRKQHPNSPLVFYCNGVTCSKSYKAAEKARVWGFDNSFVYDAGVFTWAKTHPHKARFFNKPLDKKTVASKLISKKTLMEHCMDTGRFLSQARESGYTVYDVRDSKERAEFPIKLDGIRRLDMDKFVKFLSKGKMKGEKMLVLDNVGKQVRWLQYYLVRENAGYYRFLKGGVRQWRKDGFDNHGQPSAVARPGK